MSTARGIHRATASKGLIAMVTCSSCGSSSGVQIARETSPDGAAAAASGPRWIARCDECGAVWTFVD